MEQFTLDHAKLLLGKEWLVKVDTQNSIPYLMKYTTDSDSRCMLLVTDTKRVWAEVLSRKEFARRWRASNILDAGSLPEESWRKRKLDLVSNVHTIPGMSDVEFDVVTSNYADLALELECEDFRWRWETYFVGYPLSAEIISKHLVFPLISLNHLAFSSPVADTSDEELGQAIDKVGKAARRSIDIHVKNVISKPRFSTSLRRITANFDFIADLPPVLSFMEKPRDGTGLREGSPPAIDSPQHPPAKASQVPADHKSPSPEIPPPPEPVTVAVDSATESEDEEVLPVKPQPAVVAPLENASPSPPPPRGKVPAANDLDLEPDSPPPRPVKKKQKREVSSSDDGSEKERKSVPVKGTGVKRGGGTRQPIKRGGKRF